MKSSKNFYFYVRPNFKAFNLFNEPPNGNICISVLDMISLGFTQSFKAILCH